VTLLWKTYYHDKIPHVVAPCGSFWWKYIIKLMPGITSCQIGTGEAVLFWKDDWLGTIAADKFPRAYSYALSEDVSVKSFLLATSLSANFSLPVSPEAFEEIKQLQQEVRNADIGGGPQDIWKYVWGSEFYSSKKYYELCFRNIKPHAAFNWIWKSKCTPKVKFFCWLLFSDRLNTRNLLKRKNMLLQSGYRCIMCTNPPEETVEHLFFHCPFSKDCWNILGMSWHNQGNRLTIVSKAKENRNCNMFMEKFMLGAWNIWKEEQFTLQGYYSHSPELENQIY